jgi:hypothetical protein
MRQSITLLSVLAGAAYAANTIDFVFPGGESDTSLPCVAHLTSTIDSEGVDPVATILSANPSTTAMHIACPSGVDMNDCGWGVGFDYTIISKSHYQAQLTFDSATLSFGCDYNTAKADMTCVVDEGTGPATSVLSGSEISLNHATVVQGAELLSASGSASVAPKTTGAAVATKTGVQMSGSASVTGSTASKASSSATGSAAAVQTTGAAARYGVQGSALLIFAGAAAANIL